MTPMEEQRIAEVVEAATDRITAQCYRLYGASPLGTLVRTGGDTPIYAVVSGITTASLDPGRKVIARGADEATQEDIYRNNPQLERLMRTDFVATVVGHSTDDGISHFLPPLPPPIHTFVYACEPQETRRFTELLDFLPLMTSNGGVVGDEVVGAFLLQAAAASPDPQEFLVRAGREVASLLSDEVQRLNLILRRISR